MAKQIINIGSAPNSGNGDVIRTAFTKVNDNFTELYARNVFSGSYNDLTGKPTIPTDVSQLTDTTNLLGSGGGNANTGNIQFRNDSMSSLTGVIITNADQTTASTASITIPANDTASALSIQNNNNIWSFTNDGKLQLPSGGDIVNSSGDSILNNLGYYKIQGNTIGTQGVDANSWGSHAISIDPGGESWAGIFIPELLSQDGSGSLNIYNNKTANNTINLSVYQGNYTFSPTKLTAPASIELKNSLKIEASDVDALYDNYQGTIFVLEEIFNSANYTGPGYPASKNSYDALVEAREANPSSVPPVSIPAATTVKNAYYSWASATANLTASAYGFHIENGDGVGWRFEESTGLRFPDSTLQNTAWTGIAPIARRISAPDETTIKVTSTGNPDKIWTFGTNGALTLPQYNQIRSVGSNAIITLNGVGTNESILDLSTRLDGEGVTTSFEMHPNGVGLNSVRSIDIHAGYDYATLKYDVWQGAEAVWVNVRDQDEQISGVTRPWSGMPSYEAYPVLMNYNHSGQGLPPASNLVPIAADANDAYDTWQEEQAAINVTVSAIDKTWTFGNNGNLGLPNGAILKDSANGSLAFGQEAGLTDQGQGAVAIGNSAGKATQGTRATAVGANAGQWSQSADAVALGYLAGHNQQSSSAIAIGSGAASSNQGVNAIAIGGAAGASNQGWNSIAIGSFAGSNSQHHYSIILNATGMPLDSDGQSRFYVNPIRNTNGGAFLNYNTTTKEVGYSTELTLANGATISDTESQTLFTTSFTASPISTAGQSTQTIGIFTSDGTVWTGGWAQPLLDTISVGWFVSGVGLNGVKAITSITPYSTTNGSNDIAITVDSTDGSVFTGDLFTFYSPDYRVVPAATTLTVNSSQFKFIANGDLQLPNGALLGQNRAEVAAKQQDYNVMVQYWNTTKELDLIPTAQAAGITSEGWPFIAWDLSEGNPEPYLIDLTEAWAVQNIPSSPPTPLIFNPPISASLYQQMRTVLTAAVNRWNALQTAISSVQIVAGDTNVALGDGKLTTPEIIQTNPEEDLIIRTRYEVPSSPPGVGSPMYFERNFIFGTNGTLTFPNGTVQYGAAIDLAYLKSIVASSTSFEDFKNSIANL